MSSAIPSGRRFECATSSKTPEFRISYLSGGSGWRRRQSAGRLAAGGRTCTDAHWTECLRDEHRAPSPGEPRPRSVGRVSPRHRAPDRPLDRHLRDHRRRGRACSLDPPEVTARYRHNLERRADWPRRRCGAARSARTERNHVEGLRISFAGSFCAASRPAPISAPVLVRARVMG
jgi:hypothetical protein